MSTRSRIFSDGLLATALCLVALPLAAQEPKPPVREVPPLIEGNGNAAPDQDSGDIYTPDNRPLTGAQVQSIGTPEARHSYWVPGVSFVQSGSWNPWIATSYLVGNVSLLQSWRTAQLQLNYSGGGVLYGNGSQSNTYLQQFSATQSFHWQRFQLVLIDQFAYLPESQFGFGIGNGLQNPGVTGPGSVPQPGTNGSYVPNQSIFSTIGPRYSNASVVQANYMLSARGSFTTTASYSLLRFIDSGNVNSDQMSFGAGYNYVLSPKDTIGLSYHFSPYRFPDQPQGINDHAVQFAFSHVITGRLAFQASAGPDISEYRIPVNGKTTRVSAAASAGLSYLVPKGSISLSYSRGVSGGSGVFVGGEADQVTATLSRRLSRVWSGNVFGGYAHNANKFQLNSAGTVSSFNSGYVGGGASRPLARSLNLTLSYSAFIESNNVASSNAVQQQFSIGLQWVSRPYVLH